MNFSPVQILLDAQKAVPAVRYAFGVAGISAVVAIVAGFQLDPRIAVFGTIIVLGLMFVLVVFSALAAHAVSLVHVALFAAWCFVVLTVATSTMLMTSYFFYWPRSIALYLPRQTLIDQVQNLLFELSGMQANYDARWKEIEPLAERAVAMISARFPNQATAIQDAKDASQSTMVVAGILNTQLLIVRDQLSRERK